MSVEKLSADELNTQLQKNPERKVGRWAKICDDVLKTKQAVKVTGVSRGVIYNIRKQCKAKGLESRIVDKGAAVIIFPPKTKEA